MAVAAAAAAAAADDDDDDDDDDDTFDVYASLSVIHFHSRSAVRRLAAAGAYLQAYHMSYMSLCVLKDKLKR